LLCEGGLRAGQARRQFSRRRCLHIAAGAKRFAGMPSRMTEERQDDHQAEEGR